MRNKGLIINFGLGLILVFAVASTGSGATEIHETRGPAFLREQANPKDSVDLGQLCSTEPAMRSQSRKDLLAEADHSTVSRERIIRQLLDELKATPPDWVQTHFEKWRCISEILADLDAVQSISFLIKHADYNNGVMGFSLSHFPVLRAIVQMGEEAVPYLAKFLGEEHPRQVRLNAVRSLKYIAEESELSSGAHQNARQVLQSALLQEKDARVHAAIDRALSEIEQVERRQKH